LRNVGNTKVFRFPAKKIKGQAAGKTQANLVELTKSELTGKFYIVRNGHINIIDP
jgi:hypothetical protein